MNYPEMSKEELLAEQAELLRKRDTLNKWGDLSASPHGKFLKEELVALKEHARSAYRHIPAGDTLCPILLAKLQERETVLNDFLGSLNDKDKSKSTLDNEMKSVKHWLSVRDVEPPDTRRQSIHQGEGDYGRS